VTDHFEVQRLGHANHVSNDYDATKRAYQQVFDGWFFREWAQPEHGTTNALITLSDTCIEVFSVTDPGSPLGRWAGRQGLGGWHSLEWTIPSQDEGDEILRQRSIRITDRAEGAYTYSHPRDCHGLCLELTEHHFADDPRDDPGHPRQPTYWRDEQPLGVTGLACIRVSAADATVSAEWLADLTGTDVTYERARPGLGARAAGVALAGHTIEFVSPVGTGPIEAFLASGGERIYGLSYQVADLEGARAHLAKAGVAVSAGSHEACLEIDPAVTQGARFELTAE
jgi:hypothetical protein